MSTEQTTDAQTTEEAAALAERVAAARAEYAERRAQDWETFTASNDRLPDHWERWEAETHGWKQRVAFYQPVGTDYPEFLAPIETLLADLAAMEEIEIPPLASLYLNVVTIGHLMSTDVMWSQVETFYVNAAPRIHRVEPFTMRLRGISVTDDGIYLGVEDGYALREARKQIGIGVGKVQQRLKDEDPDGTAYMPQIAIGYFTGNGSRDRVVAALADHRDVDLGEHKVTHIKMGRVGAEPQIHYPPLDVVAEISLNGKNHRRGYHN